MRGRLRLACRAGGHDRLRQRLALPHWLPQQLLQVEGVEDGVIMRVIVGHNIHLPAWDALGDALDALRPGGQLVAGVEIIEAVAAALQVLAAPPAAIAPMEAPHPDPLTRQPPYPRPQPPPHPPPSPPP